MDQTSDFARSRSFMVAYEAAHGHVVSGFDPASLGPRFVVDLVSGQISLIIV